MLLMGINQERRGGGDLNNPPAKTNPPPPTPRGFRPAAEGLFAPTSNQITNRFQF